MEVGQHLDPRNLDSRSAQRDGLKIVSGHQAIAMLEIVGDLLFSFARGLGISATPCGDGICNLEAGGQYRTCTDGTRANIPGGANAEVIRCAHAGLIRRTPAVSAI